MNSKILSASLSLLFSVVITGCSGGGGGDTDTTAQGATDTVIALQAITGGATKGPLTNANVAVYALSFDGGPVQVSSTAVDTGSTSGQAKIQDLALPFPLNPPYLLKFTATASTKDLSTCTNPADLSTCFAPILNTMSTVITSKMLAAGQNIYATPLTSMATNIALKQAATDATQFKANLSTAAKQVASTLGFGMSSRIDIFNTPPLVDETTDTTDELGDTASYRSAIEAVGAVVHEIQQNSTATDATSVLDELSDDLAFDGVIDGQTASGTSEVVTSNTLQVFEQEPTTLVIPNSGGTTVAAVTT
ncbi:MAG: hypothetical protein OEY43_09755, partial [Gammaproteobacteria bacterium]|nr:hypothetical protein [Gammaproteobacteria bacterium]